MKPWQPLKHQEGAKSDRLFLGDELILTGETIASG
jgi:hypothetical protein